MELAFSEALILPLATGTWVIQDFRALLEKYPFESASAATGGIVAGAVVGGGSVFAHPTTGGSLALGAQFSGSQLCHLLKSMAFGGVAGFFAMASLLGVVSLAHLSLTSEADSRARALAAGRQQLECSIEALHRKELLPEALIELRELFDRCFVRSVIQQPPDARCIVCDGVFREEHEEQRALRVPDCVAQHFVHESCQRDLHKVSFCCQACSAEGLEHKQTLVVQA